MTKFAGLLLLFPIFVFAAQVPCEVTLSTRPSAREIASAGLGVDDPMDRNIARAIDVVHEAFERPTAPQIFYIASDLDTRTSELSARLTKYLSARNFSFASFYDKQYFLAPDMDRPDPEWILGENFESKFINSVWYPDYRAAPFLKDLEGLIRFLAFPFVTTESTNNGPRFVEVTTFPREVVLLIDLNPSILIVRDGNNLELNEPILKNLNTFLKAQKKLGFNVKVLLHGNLKNVEGADHILTLATSSMRQGVRDLELKNRDHVEEYNYERGPLKLILVPKPR